MVTSRNRDSRLMDGFQGEAGAIRRGNTDRREDADFLDPFANFSSGQGKLLVPPSSCTLLLLVCNHSYV